MSLIGLKLLNGTFVQDPKIEWEKIDNVGIGESKKFGYKEINWGGKGIGNLLDTLINDPYCVVVIFNWNTGVAYIKNGFNLDDPLDIKKAEGYSSFILKKRIPDFFKITPTPTPVPTPVPSKIDKRISIYVMPGNQLIKNALTTTATATKNKSLLSFSIAFWNSNGWDCGDIDETLLTNGHQFTISFGGAAGCESPSGIRNSGGELALQNFDTDTLANEYYKVISKYKFKYADFDIEGQYDSHYQTFTKRNAAIVKLQKMIPDLKVSFTIAGNLDSSRSMILDAITKGVKIDTLNLMCMNYGYKTDLVKIIIENLQRAHKMYPNLNLGFIPLLGLDDQKINTYSLQNHKDIVQTIHNQKMTSYVKLFSFWCLNIDANLSYLKEYLKYT